MEDTKYRERGLKASLVFFFGGGGGPFKPAKHQQGEKLKAHTQKSYGKEEEKHQPVKVRATSLDPR